ncbi:MAG: flagellar biosynthetic protein FliO [Lachnospiraceae bacterium]|nr:flagellar biosynthetic protein FliO [Lachnospiraceae bacterium]MDE6698017.1 flagellar biosynthetic protein FliO [Lachnospiraceae bacterium]
MSILASTGLDGVLRFIALLVVFAIVLGVTYFVTRWIGSFQKEKYSKGNIKIIEAKQIGNNKFIYIAKIGNDYFALSSGKENLSLIGKIDEEGITFPDDSNDVVYQPFSSVFEKVRNLKKPKE